MSDIDIELHSAELNDRVAIMAFKKSDDKCDQLDLASDVYAVLKNAEEGDTTLLEFMKPALESVNINCESNQSAIDGLEKLISNGDIDQESFLIGWLAATGVVVAVEFAIKALGITSSYGTKLTTIVAKLKQIKIGDKFWDSKMNVAKDEMYSFKQFSDYIGGFTKAIKIIRDADGYFDKSVVDKVQSAMSSIGVKLTDEGVVEFTKRYVPVEDTMKELGWDPTTAKKSIEIMDDLAKALVSIKGSKEKALAMIKKAKVESDNKELSDSEKEQLKKKSEEIKKSSKFIAKFIKATIYKGWTFNVKWICEDAEYVVNAYDSSKYKDKMKLILK